MGFVHRRDARQTWEPGDRVGTQCVEEVDLESPAERLPDEVPDGLDAHAGVGAGDAAV
jgi:hypothetical protein